MLIKPPTPSAKQALFMIAIAFILAALVVDRINTWWSKRQAVTAATAPITSVRRSARLSPTRLRSSCAYLTGFSLVAVYLLRRGASGTIAPSAS